MRKVIIALVLAGSLNAFGASQEDQAYSFFRKAFWSSAAAVTASSALYSRHQPENGTSAVAIGGLVCGLGTTGMLRSWHALALIEQRRTDCSYINSLWYVGVYFVTGSRRAGISEEPRAQQSISGVSSRNGRVSISLDGASLKAVRDVRCGGSYLSEVYSEDDVTIEMNDQGTFINGQHVSDAE